jgi:general secretion pathway protein G
MFNQETNLRRSRKRTARSGFTMGEMVIVIAVLAILAALITPLAVNVITQERFDACRDELEVIKKAIVGDDTLIEGGTRSSFGFVGDMGMLPRTLNDLMVQGTLTGLRTDSGVLWGWRGPYVSEATDPWGRPYTYTISSALGTAVSFIDLPTVIATLRSSGPDTAVTTDDVVLDIRTDEVYSMLSGNTLDNCGAGAACTLTVYSPNGTAMTSTSAVTTAETPIYNLTNFYPIGIRRISYSIAGTVYYKNIYISNGPLTGVNCRQPGTCPAM